jgi:hypothetical protein
MILAVCCAAISMLPLSAASLNSLLGSTPATGLVVGNVDFYDFSFSASCAGEGTVFSCSQLISDGFITGIGSETNPGSLQISPDTAGGLDGFNVTGALKTIADGSNPTTMDITLTYDAEIVQPSSNLIGDVYLEGSVALNPACTSGSCPPNPSIAISETVTSTGVGQIGFLQVTDPPPVMADLINLSTDVSSLSVTKDIDLDSGTGTNGGTADYASVTTITQQLSQVPEPRAYAAVLGLFLALFFVIKRRKQTATA